MLILLNFDEIFSRFCELSGGTKEVLRKYSGIGTSSAGRCIWPTHPLFAHAAPLGPLSAAQPRDVVQGSFVVVDVESDNGRLSVAAVSLFRSSGRRRNRAGVTWPHNSNFELFHFPISVILFKFPNFRFLPNFRIPGKFGSLEERGGSFKFRNSRKNSNIFYQI